MYKTKLKCQNCQNIFDINKMYSVDACCEKCQIELDTRFKQQNRKSFTLRVYIDNGIIYSYNVSSPEKVREHSDAIINGGYRHNDGKTEFVHYPPHRILKVVCKESIPTNYPDVASGT